MSEGRSYSLAARDTTGVFLGLGASEIILISAGFAATLALRMFGVPVIGAAIPLLVAAGAARVRVGGRPLYQWLPLLIGWAAASAVGRKSWRAPLPLLPSHGSQSPRPPVLAGLDVIEIPTTDGVVAAVRDRRSARVTALMPVGATRFVGAEPLAQDGLLAAWGDVLATAAAVDGPVVLLGWSHQARPTTLHAHRSWAGGGQAAFPPGDYERLVDEVATLAIEHETVVWVTVSGREIAGKGRLLDRAAAELPSVVDAASAALRNAGVAVGDPFAVGDLWRLLRHRADPDPGIVSHPTFSLATRMGFVCAEGGPLAMDTAWGEVRIDGAWHRSYWVEAWPRRPVPADWLAGFLAEAEGTTTTVLYRPIDPGRSQRRVDSQLVKFSAHRERKERKAYRVTETEQRAEQAVHDLEAELASGYAEVLYLGLVSVTAQSREELDQRCQAVAQLARSSQLGLRALHGRQDVAWAATLPFGLAEPGLVEVAGL